MDRLKWGNSMGVIKHKQPILVFQNSGQQDEGLSSTLQQPTSNLTKGVGEQKITSNCDPLTGLLCRSAFEINRLNKGFERDLAAAIIIDFDRFTDVNEKYGRAVGDFILAIQAERLLKNDVARERIIYRYEGDRFLELVFSKNGVDEIVLMQVARDLQQNLCQPIKMKQSNVVISCCIGLALKDESKNAAQLATEALLAVEEAKQIGTGNIYLSELSTAD